VRYVTHANSYVARLWANVCTLFLYLSKCWSIFWIPCSYLRQNGMYCKSYSRIQNKTLLPLSCSWTSHKDVLMFKHCKMNEILFHQTFLGFLLFSQLHYLRWKCSWVLFECHTVVHARYLWNWKKSPRCWKDRHTDSILPVETKNKIVGFVRLASIQN
jgi:hypothetical protein